MQRLQPSGRGICMHVAGMHLLAAAWLGSHALHAAVRHCHAATSHLPPTCILPEAVTMSSLVLTPSKSGSASENMNGWLHTCDGRRSTSVKHGYKACECAVMASTANALSWLALHPVILALAPALG